MATEASSSLSTNQCSPNPCEYTIPIHLSIPISVDIEVCATNQPVSPQLIVVPIQPDLQLTPKVESRQPECLYPSGNGGYHQPEQGYALKP
ncbi:MAG: hypothetical protein MUF49_23940 [Oculatellaceae cyanobacterium Prado106]|jgi:hypothetical protein|nr:hypothetical protein [Oculatellaceae cyanobacterium Prado106]